MSVRLEHALDPSFVDAAFVAWTARVGHAVDRRNRDAFIKAFSDTMRHSEPNSMLGAVEDIRSGPLDGPVLQDLARRLFNNETYFFRDSASTESLLTKVLPDLLWERRKSKRLTVWSAGCSSGEEIYTLVILLSRLVPLTDDWRFTFIGSDLSVSALQRARAAVYTAGSLRNTSGEDRKSLFVPRENGTHELREIYRRQVQFGLENVVEPGGFAAGQKFDLVLCRNVGIYLSEDGLSRWSAKLLDARADDGILITAPTDPLPRGAGHTTHISGLSLHRKASAAAPTTALPISSVPASPRKASRPHLPSATLLDTKAAAPAVPSRPAQRPRELTSSERLTKARALGDSGHHEAALAVLDEMKPVGSTSAEVHELRGILLEAMGRLEQSALAYRKATEHSNAPRLWLRLGLLLEQLGATREARDAFVQCRDQALLQTDAEHRALALQRLSVLERKHRR